MKPSTREWISKAEADYQLSLGLSRRRKVTFHDHACFHCQQSAEKYLKARLEEVGIMSPRTHDLKNLLPLLLPVEPLCFLPFRR
jgi:HEPN domain-containing protein